ncbi:MAG: ferrochelatase [Alphaproteobacteria bacterium]
MKLAVVLFNLGAPDRPQSVRPFLRNMFSDPAILSVPAVVRFFLARLISGLRAHKTIRIYEKLGGGSPLLANTRIQAAALEKALGPKARVFVAMRYWHPMSAETAEAVKEFDPDEVILLPLYPQFSGTTSGSSFKAWTRATAKIGLVKPSYAICCYPRLEGWLAAQVELIAQTMRGVAFAGRPRVLFSAHGLPEKVIEGGDPYQWQIERTSEEIANRLGLAAGDWVVCYQSRVGPLKWIGPSTEEEIRRAAQDRVPIVIAPIAFVSEHSETLVELDEEYRHLAKEVGVPAFARVPAVAAHEKFIAGLAGLVRDALKVARPIGSSEGVRICPANKNGCPLEQARS